jgi:hypothetical protein
MWSEAVMGRQGLVGETYHRLGLYTSVIAFLQPEDETCIKRLVKSGSLSHIAVTIGCMEDVDAAALADRFKKVSSWASNPLKKVLFTVTLSEYRDEDTQSITSLCESGLVRCLSVRYQLTRERTVGALVGLREICAAGETKFQIGLESYPEDELQWIMEHSQNSATVLNFCIHNSPNLRMRQVDFGHSRLCNIMTYFDTGSSEDKRYDYIRSLSEKYSQPPALVLAKAMLQLGMLVMFDASCGDDFLEFEALSMCHPFAYRHVQMAPAQPKTFIVSDTDVQFIIAASEVVESAEDESEATSSPPIKRELAFPEVLHRVQEADQVLLRDRAPTDGGD